MNKMGIVSPVDCKLGLFVHVSLKIVKGGECSEMILETEVLTSGYLLLLMFLTANVMGYRICLLIEPEITLLC